MNILIQQVVEGLDMGELECEAEVYFDGFFRRYRYVFVLIRYDSEGDGAVPFAVERDQPFFYVRIAGGAV